MSEIMKDIQISPEEERVYLALLASGQMSIPELSQHLKITIEDVEASVNSLKEKGLVYTNHSIIDKFNAIYPLVSLSDKAKASLDTIKSIGDDINQYANEKFDKVDSIIKSQKEALQSTTASAKDEVRISTEASSTAITGELDKLIEEIGQILNTEKQELSSSALTVQSDITKHHQEVTEKAGNNISSAVSDISNSLEESMNNIVKSFETASTEVEDASETMEESLLASLDNNFNDYTKIMNEIQTKTNGALTEYNTSAKDNMDLHSQLVRENYGKVVETVNNKLGLHDKETNQILEERIRNISQSLDEMNDDFAKVIRDRLSAVRREYNSMIDNFTRNVDRLFTDADTQLESLIAAKTKTNEQKLSNLFKIMKENLQKNANETRDDIKAKEVRIGNDIRAATETTQRKMTEINDKLNMELTNSFNKSKTDFNTAKTTMSGVISRAKEDIDAKFSEARSTTITSITNEFKEKEKIFTEISSRIIDDIRALHISSESKSKEYIKTAENKAKEAIGRIEMPAKTLLNQGKQTALKHVHDQSNLVNKTIDQALVGIEDTIVAETSDMKSQFRGFGDKYKESSKLIERLLSTMELTYRELISKVKDQPRPTVNTTTIIGKDAILNQMKVILEKVKSTITLVYPDISDIHVEELMNSNPRTRIIVISDFDPFKNADTIKRLMSKDNIQLKSLAIGSVNKPYYAVGRDAEEGLIATLDESGQVIAITSDSLAFVELISAEIINGVLTPKTKRVVLPDS